ncbi:hypothetical protein GDO81_007874 [Engystomops pustulosus]|uniref:Uncharacterized protein n=1 Tax=Engystomops pustulosus TaxID=76066 RepID=A0AAV7CBA8_ENGPU|nr:hypothetical protein GDO81_007874 [Engystomops pustulosus]
MTAMLSRWSGAARLLLRPHPTYAGGLDWVRAGSNSPTQSNSSTKLPLKKPKTPQGRFDETEAASKEKEPLESECINGHQTVQTTAGSTFMLLCAAFPQVGALMCFCW